MLRQTKCESLTSKLNVNFSSCSSCLPTLEAVRYVLSTRFISPVNLSTDDGSDNELSCELDSHADTCVAGAACLLVAHNGQKVSVQPLAPNTNRSGMFPSRRLLRCGATQLLVNVTFLSFMKLYTLGTD
jgi:hypothetical protein